MDLNERKKQIESLLSRYDPFLGRITQGQIEIQQFKSLIVEVIRSTEDIIKASFKNYRNLEKKLKLYRNFDIKFNKFLVQINTLYQFYDQELNKLRSELQHINSLISYYKEEILLIESRFKQIITQFYLWEKKKNKLIKIYKKRRKY